MAAISSANLGMAAFFLLATANEKMLVNANGKMQMKKCKQKKCKRKNANQNADEKMQTAKCKVQIQKSNDARLPHCW